jgi:O-acetyl-ADP-ribose deacetylase (regulator of RNase III)
MFQTVNGNLFDSSAQALVNPVNCVGTMGAGLAREFRLRFPEMHADYLSRCARGEVRIGELTAFHERDTLIINFPTKHDWRERSKLAHIESGLHVLRQLILENELESVAIPALGCGLGGLSWTQVEPRIRVLLCTLTKVRLELYPPQPRARHWGR